jgi:hypothetical protein
MLAEGGKIWNHPSVGAGIPMPARRERFDRSKPINFIGDTFELLAGLALFVIGIVGSVKNFSAIHQEVDKVFSNHMNTYVEKGDSLVTKLYDSSHITNLATPFIFLVAGVFLVSILFRLPPGYMLLSGLPILGASILFAFSGSWAMAESSAHVHDWVSKQTNGGQYLFFTNDKTTIISQDGKEIGTLTLKDSENGDTTTATIKYYSEEK